MKFRILCMISCVLLAMPTMSSATPSKPWFSPLAHVGVNAWRTFTCVIRRESNSTWSHPNLGDNNRYGSSGVFQIEDATWLARSGFRFHVWQASPYQQAVGAFNLWRADGFAPWVSDGCI
jgi:hypothetical protein